MHPSRKILSFAAALFVLNLVPFAGIALYEGGLLPLPRDHADTLLFALPLVNFVFTAGAAVFVFEAGFKLLDGRAPFHGRDVTGRDRKAVALAFVLAVLAALLVPASAVLLFWRVL